MTNYKPGDSIRVTFVRTVTPSGRILLMGRYCDRNKLDLHAEAIEVIKLPARVAIDGSIWTDDKGDRWIKLNPDRWAHIGTGVMAGDREVDKLTVTDRTLL